MKISSFLYIVISMFEHQLKSNVANFLSKELHSSYLSQDFYIKNDESLEFIKNVNFLEEKRRKNYDKKHYKDDKLPL